jgi:DNA invertase Pin-like site-specific DNA recombinase
MTPTPKTVLYLRVSTAEQTSAHQLSQAREAGFQIEDEHVIADHGVSGVSTRLKERDQGKRLFDLLQPGDTLLVRWVDRLGRNYEDVKEVIETFNKKGVAVATVINGMVFEADHKLTDPTLKASRNAILGFMAALAEADATAKREARQAGIDHARKSADADRKYRGKKPSFDRATFDTVQTMLAQKAHTVSAIARETGLSRQAVLRIRDTPEAADAALRRWEKK